MAKKAMTDMNVQELLAKAIEALGQRSTAVGPMMVGIRNVSNYTIGLIDTTSGKAVEYNLEAPAMGRVSPKTRAVIPYSFWQQLRNSKFVGNGMIIRDDTVLGPTDLLAPPDRPEDLHPDAEKNLVLEPREWIVSKSEAELRDAVALMTSEPSLRRLLEAVNDEIYLIGEAKYKEDAERAKKSVRDLPAQFRLVEELCEERLDELNPVAAVRYKEVEAIKDIGHNYR